MLRFPFESTNRALFLAINAPADLAGVSLSFAIIASNYLFFAGGTFAMGLDSRPTVRAAMAERVHVSMLGKWSK